jgi:hypothetical protein
MAKKQAAPPTESTPPPVADPRAERNRALLEGQDIAPADDSVPAETPEDQTPPEDEVVEDAPTELEEPVEPGFLDRARELGYDAEDEHAAAMQMADAYQRLVEERESQQRRLSEMQELAEYGTQYLRQQRE